MKVEIRNNGRTLTFSNVHPNGDEHEWLTVSEVGGNRVNVYGDISLTRNDAASVVAALRRFVEEGDMALPWLVTPQTPQRKHESGNERDEE